MDNYSQKVTDLFDDQLRVWKLARENYHLLSGVRQRRVSFPGYEIVIQFNPGRIVSSSAMVDTKSIEARPCFLCEENRPPQQRGVSYGDQFIILINPFPIFSCHLTIASVSHIPQRIAGSFADMLSLSRHLPEYVIFYNGPECGASAPDHLHFQAGNRGFLPIEKDIANHLLLQKSEASGEAELWLWRNYGRGMVTLKGTEREELTGIFDRLVQQLASLQPERPEPMLNILAYHDKGEWTIHVIPRKVHRPACYFAEGDDKILFSPASVDMGGVFITPRSEDFEVMTPEIVSTILDEVCYNDDELNDLVKDLL